MNTQNEELNRLKKNDVVVIVSLLIVIAWFIANKIDEKNLKENITNDKVSHYIRLAIFITSILIYLYFLNTNFKIFKNPLENMTKKERLVNKLNLFASIVFLVGGLVVLYVEILRGKDDINTGFF